MNRNLEERLSTLGLNMDETVYRLTIGDAAMVVLNNLPIEDAQTMTDEELETLVEKVAENFENIDWYEWGVAGYDFYKDEILGGN